jgi:hypothetical protein
MKSELLRERIKDLLESGCLPRMTQPRTWVGYGSGSACDICREQIGIDDVEYEIEDATQQTKGLRLHLHCHNLWNDALAERLPIRAVRDTPPPRVQRSRPPVSLVRIPHD